MDKLAIYMQDSRVIIALLGVCAIAIIIAILKKAAKLIGIILMCGIAIAIVRPITTQLMIENGVSIEGTVLTIKTESEQHVVDLSLGASIDTIEQENGDYVITLNIPQQSPQTITVSKSTATWVKFGANVIMETEKVGEEIVDKHLRAGC